MAVLEMPISLTWAAAPDVFQLHSITGTEHLGTLYEYQLHLVSESHLPLGDEGFRRRKSLGKGKR